jgi:hypothetical protein
VARIAWLAALAACVLGASAAGAIDLTGTWAESKPPKCKILNADGTRETTREPFFVNPVAIVQTGAVLHLEGDGENYTGFVLATTKDVGEGFVQHCPEESFLVSLHITSAKVKGDRATMKMELGSGGDAFVRSCTLTLERTATAAPVAPGCGGPALARPAR